MKIIFSSSVAIYDGAQDCRCNPTGSEHSQCNVMGGQCQCKPNVIGRQCDQCAPGSFGFGPAGCTLCGCSPTGSMDTSCDETTGQCRCVANAYGRQCASCQRGFYGFPSCRPCECNGRADECDDSGQCLRCADNTGGARCDRCADGFYGDLRSGCRPCMCPGGQGSGQQHGDTCRLDPRTNQIICDCKPGYTGVTCDRCAENYFGRPLSPGGRCERCECNRNIDHGVPGSCDAATGECLKCQFNTEGYQCERCKPGFFGDASRQSCIQCACSPLGTHRGAGPCHPVTGQCQCLPHVTGRNCDQCEPDHWKIASGTGCEPCGCHPYGSISTQCNEFDGQCRCRPDRGGRTCSDCPDGFWGNPDERTAQPCRRCECDYQGSASNQCDRRTGQCECAPGVAGDRCDRCARGTTGSLPYCTPCGECFDNWDRIINEIRSEVNILIQEGSQIQHGGAQGAFESEFREMEYKLDEVRRILDEFDQGGEGDLVDLRRQLEIIRLNLTSSSSTLDQLDTEIYNTSNRIEVINGRIESIKIRIEILLQNARWLRGNATDILITDVTGAFNDIKQSYERSRTAQVKVDSTTTIIQRSEYVRDQVDRLINSRKNAFDQSYGQNEQTLREINITLIGINSKIVDLNEIVCDGRGDPCHPSCGGAGCGKCGGGSNCQNGAVSKSNSALDLSQRSETLLREKQQEVDITLNEINDARRQCDMAHDAAQMAHDRAEFAKNESETSRADLEALITRITVFLSNGGATSQEVRDVAEEVLRMTISLTPDQITYLAIQINETIRGLTDIDSILDATRADLERVKILERRANDAKKSAEDVLRTAQRIIELLRLAAEAQGKAETAISSTRVEISRTEQDLNTIERTSTETNIQSSNTLTRVIDLRERVRTLKERFTENELNVQRASREAMEAEGFADKAERDANELEIKYVEVSRQLEMKYNETRIAKERADLLKNKAMIMFESISTKVTNLRGWEREFVTKERDLTSILSQIYVLHTTMGPLVRSIKDAERYLRTCGTA